MEYIHFQLIYALLVLILTSKYIFVVLCGVYKEPAYCMIENPRLFCNRHLISMHKVSALAEWHVHQDPLQKISLARKIICSYADGSHELNNKWFWKVRQNRQVTREEIWERNIERNSKRNIKGNIKWNIISNIKNNIKGNIKRNIKRKKWARYNRPNLEIQSSFSYWGMIETFW